MKYDKTLMARLMDYSEIYEINFQLWPECYSIYISKDGIDLHSYGGESEPNKTMKRALEYLDRINKKVYENNG